MAGESQTQGLATVEESKSFHSTFLPPLPPSNQRLEKSAQSLSNSSIKMTKKGVFNQDGLIPGHRDIQNAASRRLLQQYYTQQPGTVPVDWRNGLDMRTLYPAQDPGYLEVKSSNTYETCVKAVRPHYEGAIVENLRDGHGKCTFRNSLFSYEGDWAAGKMHGHGKLFFGESDFVEGDFRDGEITGSGMRQWANGSQYTGEFLDGEMHGQGLHLLANGDRFEGGFCRNQRWGHGVLVKADGSRYEGVFEEHRLNGPGNYEGSNGDVYKGDWCNGNQDGVGEFVAGNGDHYKGRWAAGRKHGPGVFFHAASGVTWDCDWLNDAPRVRPEALSAETEERLFWVPPPKPEVPEGEDGEEAAEPEEEEPPQPPPSLVEVLQTPISAGGQLPSFIISISNPEQECQTGETGRLIHFTLGVYEREAVPEPEEGEAAEPEEGEEEEEKPLPPFKEYPTTIFEITYNPPKPATPEPEEAAEEDTEEATKEEDAKPEEGEEGEEPDPAQHMPFPFPKTYPPKYSIAGIKLVQGRAKIEGISLPEDIPAGEYHLKVEPSFETPFGVVKPVYLPIVVE